MRIFCHKKHSWSPLCGRLWHACWGWISLWTFLYTEDTSTPCPRTWPDGCCCNGLEQRPGWSTPSSFPRSPDGCRRICASFCRTFSRLLLLMMMWTFLVEEDKAKRFLHKVCTAIYLPLGPINGVQRVKLTVIDDGGKNKPNSPFSYASYIITWDSHSQ